MTGDLFKIEVEAYDCGDDTWEISVSGVGPAEWCDAPEQFGYPDADEVARALIATAGRIARVALKAAAELPRGGPTLPHWESGLDPMYWADPHSGGPPAVWVRVDPDDVGGWRDRVRAWLAEVLAEEQAASRHVARLWADRPRPPNTAPNVLEFSRSAPRPG